MDRRAENLLARLAAFLDPSTAGYWSWRPAAGGSHGDYFREYGQQPAPCEDYAAFRAAADRFMLAAGPLAAGFVLEPERIAFVTETELYASHVRNRAAREAGRRTSVDSLLKDLSELKPGDPVVHEQHGIGRYRGLATLDLGEGRTEFLHLEYEGGDKLYVPVSHLHLISRYSGVSPEAAPLYRLGSGQWEKARKKAAIQVRDTAAELLNLYAQRAARQGHAFQLRQHDCEAFADGFGFDETPDQAAAIQAVTEDLTRGRPMDRLICGDVGFGKTEVALRAAFIAALDGKQVAVLCLTTKLAFQH